MQNYSFIYAIKYSKPVYYKIIYLVEQHPVFGFDLHNLHHSVEHVVFHALDDVLGLGKERRIKVGVEPVRLECRLYPREDLGELPVLYPDA